MPEFILFLTEIFHATHSIYCPVSHLIGTPRYHYLTYRYFNSLFFEEAVTVVASSESKKRQGTGNQFSSKEITWITYLTLTHLVYCFCYTCITFCLYIHVLMCCSRYKDTIITTGCTIFYKRTVLTYSAVHLPCVCSVLWNVIWDKTINIRLKCASPFTTTLSQPFLHVVPQFYDSAEGQWSLIHSN